jgi:lipoyl(octanoyl) transferase
MAYAPALAVQREHLDEVLAARDAGAPEIGRMLLVEHDPVITIGRRPGAARHLSASPESLARLGVDVCETDRGGDVTYHGPGQLVIYPILDLNALRLGLHAYMRMLEGAVIEAVARFDVRARRDPSATGVWVETGAGGEPALAKVCAMGVRVRRWASMHGLALNVSPDLSHFELIVPCGLARPVTSLRALLGDRCPPMGEVKRALVDELVGAIHAADRGVVQRPAPASA